MLRCCVQITVKHYNYTSYLNYAISSLKDNLHCCLSHMTNLLDFVEKKKRIFHNLLKSFCFKSLSLNCVVKDYAKYKYC